MSLLPLARPSISQIGVTHTLDPSIAPHGAMPSVVCRESTETMNEALVVASLSAMSTATTRAVPTTSVVPQTTASVTARRTWRDRDREQRESVSALRGFCLALLLALPLWAAVIAVVWFLAR